MTEAYPLQWPEGWPRTPAHRRVDSRNRWGRGEKNKRRPWTFSEARDELYAELERAGAKGTIVSTNFRLTQGGMPSKSFGVPDDQGVAIYFTMNDKPMVMAQDGHTRAEENLRSLALVLKYLRGVEDLGGGVMMERAFTGFSALPAPGQQSKRSWRQVFGLPENSSMSVEMIDATYRSLSKKRRPDAPSGSHDQMAELNAARAEALQEMSQ